jgi:hypothetical protein
MRDAIPPEVFDAIRRQYRESFPLHPRDYEDLRGDEDSISGAVGSALRHQVRGQRGGMSWETRVKKLRGRGHGAPERGLGADLIIEIEVRGSDGGVVARKGLLAQSKKEWKGKDWRLLKQVRDMETHVPNSSVVLDYSPIGCTAARGSDVLAAEGHRRNLTSPLGSVGDLLADGFLVCTVGRRDMYFDANRELLIFPGPQGLISLGFTARGRVRTTVYPSDEGSI